MDGIDSLVVIENFEVVLLFSLKIVKLGSIAMDTATKLSTTQAATLANEIIFWIMKK